MLLYSPYPGRKPFWSLDIQLLAVAIETSLLERIPVYNLYRVFSRLMLNMLLRILNLFPMIIPT